MFSIITLEKIRRHGFVCLNPSRPFYIDVLLRIAFVPYAMMTAEVVPNNSGKVA